MTGLFKRIRWAVQEWRQVRRDVALSRQFLDGSGDTGTIKKMTSPTTRILLEFLDKFIACDHEAVKLGFDGASISFEPQIFLRMPLNFPHHWGEVLADVISASHDIAGFSEQELRMHRGGHITTIFIQRRLMTEEMLESLRQDPGQDLGIDSLLTFSKTPLSERNTRRANSAAVG